VSLTESWGVLRARWVSLVAAALIGLTLAAAYLLVATAEYTARSEVFLAVENGTTSTDLAQGSNYATQQARNYSALATRDIVLEPVVTALTLPMTPVQLGRQVTASVPLNSSLISISVTDSSPERATAVANAVATSLSNQVVKLVPNRRDGTSPIRLQVVQSASIPVDASTPGAPLVLALGLLLGLLAGAALVLISERVSMKVRSVEQVERISGVTVLGSVAYDRQAVSDPILSETSGSPRSESYRQIRTVLRFRQAGTAHKAFVVTSAVPDEGKTSSAANLAATLAASGSSVCLVEADLRQPRLGSYLDLDSPVGLTDLLTGDVALDDALQSWGPYRVKVLLSGALPPNPSELLGSGRAEAMLRSLTERFDVTIVDCPPLLPVTDAALLARSLGGAILVVGAGRVEVREVEQAVAALSAVGADLLGVVVNRAPGGSRAQYHPRTERRGRAPQWDVQEQTPVRAVAR